MGGSLSVDSTYYNLPWMPGMPTDSMGYNSCSPTSNSSFATAPAPYVGDTYSSGNVYKIAEKESKKIEATSQQREALLTEKKEIVRQEKEVAETEAKLKNGKQKDGSTKIVQTLEEHKKLPWWKKTLRAVTNIGQGIIKIATNFIGFEDGKWNWKKCLKNVGIAAAAIGLSCIPYVGPFIGYGLMATGVVTGAINVGKGIHKASNAKTLEELDQAYQDIGGGAFIGITSALGLRGLGKGFRTTSASTKATTTTSGATQSTTGVVAESASATTSATTSATVTSNASVAVTRSSVMGKAWQNTSQFGRDITVNALKSTLNSTRQQGVMYNTFKSEATGHFKGLKAFGKVYKSNASKLLPAVGKEKFNQSKQNLVDKIQRKMDEIGPNPSDKLLAQELKMLQAEQRELSNLATRNQWANVKKSSHAAQEVTKLKEKLTILNSNGQVKVNGKILKSSNPEDVAALNGMIKRAELLAKDMKSLAKVRENTIRWVALRPKKNEAELTAYCGGSSRTGLGYQYDITKAHASWTGALKAPLKLGWNAMCLPYKPWDYMSKTAAGSFYKIEQSLLPEYEANMFVDLLAMGGCDLGVSQTITAEETKKLQAEIESTKKAIKKDKDKVESKLEKLS